MLIWTEPWSLALMMRLVALHLRGTYLRRRKDHGLVKGLYSLFYSSSPSSTGVGWAGAGAWAWKRRLSWESLWVFSGGRLQVDKLAAVVLHFDGFWGVVRRIWVVLVVARVLICLVRAFQFFEVAVVAVFRTGSGLCDPGNFPHRSWPPSPPEGLTS